MPNWPRAACFAMQTHSSPTLPRDRVQGPRGAPTHAQAPSSCDPNLVEDPLDAAIARTHNWCQLWWGRLQGQSPWLATVPDVGPACEVLLADALFHDLSAEERAGLLDWVRSQQRADGSWHGAQGRDLSLTCLGYWVCICAGDDPNSLALRKALRVVHELGGAQRAELNVRLWLAMAGTIEWSWIPSVPAQLFLLPEFMGLSIARLSPWARQVVTALHLLASGPARIHLPEVPELLLRGHEGALIKPRLTSPGLAGDLLQAFDHSLELTRRLSIDRLHRRSLARARSWLESSQQAHGGWFSTRPTLYSLLALRVVGVRSDDLRVRRGLDVLRRARARVELDDGGLALAQGCNLPALAVRARLGRVVATEQGSPSAQVHDPLLAAEIARQGPWQRRADAATGGWPEVEDGDSHLDLRASCEVLWALRGTRTTATRASMRRAAEVILAMQEPDGSFARFERGEARVPLARLPWRDADRLNLGTREDEARVERTAAALCELAVLGWRREDDRVERALAWLARVFEAQGHAWSLYALAALVQACVVQCSADDPLRRASEQVLRRRQLEDGSFGDELNTARGLAALVATGEACVQAQRAARHLVGRVGLLAGSSLGPIPRLPAGTRAGYGLSPTLRDPSAAASEIYLALRAYRERCRG